MKKTEVEILSEIDITTKSILRCVDKPESRINKIMTVLGYGLTVSGVGSIIYGVGKFLYAFLRSEL